ncbi:MAG: metallophosphoesterase [Alcaligenaceae bacterium]|nr:metallophosphoesterase [Alcaligenaceae bacterium]
MTRFSFFLRLPVLLLLAHAYVAFRLLAAVRDPLLWWLGLTALALLYALILIGFTLRGRAGRRLSDAAAWIGFLALGGFSWLFVLTVLRDVALLIVAGLGVFVPAVAGVVGRVAVMTAAAVPVLVLVAVLLGLFNARRKPRVQVVDIPIDGLPERLQGFTIVQISDLHVGPTIKHAYVQAVVDIANGLKPDLIALTGDLVDGDVEHLGRHVRPLAGLDAREGVYFVTGNHEYYCGAQQWIEAFRRLGFHVLVNEHRVVRRGEAGLVIAGVTDFGAAKFDAGQASSPSAAVRGAPSDAAVRILLAHQPRSADAALRAGFDLQLSGHTHGGQFWPWQYFVPLQQPFVAGLHRMDRLLVYVSRGTGYWGPPMRLGARSEITCLRLVNGS